MKNYILKIVFSLAMFSTLAYAQTTEIENETKAVEAKEFSLKSTDGKTVSLSDLKGNLL